MKCSQSVGTGRPISVVPHHMHGIPCCLLVKRLNNMVDSAVLSSGLHVTQVLPKLKQKTKAVVYWGAGEPSDEDKKTLKSAKIPLHSFADFEKLGRDKLKDPIPPKPQDPCTIMYTRSVAVKEGCVLGEGLLTMYWRARPLLHPVQCWARLCMHPKLATGEQMLPKAVVVTLRHVGPTQWHDWCPEGRGGHPRERGQRHCCTADVHRADWH